jgi:two-component system response regulator DesR
VAAGERVVDPVLAATLASGVSPLTARERDVLSTAIAKTGARNRTEAVRLADERGWL